MYKFQSPEEKQRFNKTLDNCIAEFAMGGSSKKQLQKVITCNVNIFRLAQLNHRNGVEHFYKNMGYYDQLTYDYLNYLFQTGLWQFTEEELRWFNR